MVTTLNSAQTLSHRTPQNPIVVYYFNYHYTAILSLTKHVWSALNRLHNASDGNLVIQEYNVRLLSRLVPQPW